MRIFLDANILFSAAKSDGAIRRLLQQLTARNHHLLADDYVVTEARRNLAARYADALPAFDSLLRRIEVHPAQAPGPELRLVEWLPDKDRVVLAAAIRLRADVLCTGDRNHFGTGYGKTYAGVSLHSPQSLAMLIDHSPR